MMVNWINTIQKIPPKKRKNRANISSSIALSGTFGAGFIGSSAAVSTTGFVAGTVTGAIAGLSSGFILNAGNSWLGGSSFGQGLSDGFKGAIMSGVTGGVTGGIFGGIDAASRGRNFWTGSYKQYDLQLNQIASADGTMFEQYSFPKDATVANADQYNVYYKPEGNEPYGIDNVVLPGKHINKPVDGVATSYSKDMVFKIPDGGRVKVLPGGDIDLTMGFIGRAKLIGYQAFTGYEYGWQNSQFFINQGAYYTNAAKNAYGWDELFKMALKIK